MMPLSEVAQSKGAKDMKERRGERREKKEGGREGKMSGADRDGEEESDNYYHRGGSARSLFENSFPLSL